ATCAGQQTVERPKDAGEEAGEQLSATQVRLTVRVLSQAAGAGSQVNTKWRVAVWRHGATSLVPLPVAGGHRHRARRCSRPARDRRLVTRPADGMGVDRNGARAV